MSKRVFFRLLLAFLLAFSGNAAQLHSLAHAQADLAAAGHGDKAPAPLKHSTEQCLVVQGHDATAADFPAALGAKVRSQVAVSIALECGGESPAAAFQSRAPPLLS